MAGRWFEELVVGDVFDHDVRRTVTETDNLLFTTLTMNTQPLHLDAEFARAAGFGQILVNSMFTLAFVMGVSVSDLTLGTTLGNLGMENVRFPAPVFIGDTLRSRTTIVASRESRSNPLAGIVTFRHEGFNQSDQLVVDCQRVGMMMKRAVGHDA